MGWCSTCGTHEGFLEGLKVADRGAFLPGSPERQRALGDTRDEPYEGTVYRVRVACSCGWRSQVLFAPVETEWAPSRVFAPAWFEDQCAQIWKLHVLCAVPGANAADARAVLLKLARSLKEDL